MYEPQFACSDNVSHGISWCSGECRWDQAAERYTYGSHEGKEINILWNYSFKQFGNTIDILKFST